MKRTSLKDHLLNVDSGRMALITSSSIFTYKQLTTSSWKGNRGVAIIIFCRQPENILRTIIALDGVVDTICVLPVNLTQKDLSSLLDYWSFDLVITDIDLPDIFASKGITGLDIDQVIVASDENEINDKCKTRWLVSTSGTTSVPKLVVHTFASLARTVVQNSSSNLDLQLWGMLYDVVRFAGLQVIFHSLINGHTLVFASPSESVQEQVDFYVEAGVTHISATPTLWRKILMTPSCAKLPLNQITLGGEAADQSILSALKEKYPNSRITHIFASTEAGVGLAVSDVRSGFPLSYVQKSFGGCEIKIVNNKLFVRSTENPKGYADGAQFFDADGWVDTGDLVKVERNRFYIVGRESGIINVGGDKVVPEQVRDALLGCEIVQEAIVYPKRNAITGALVAANVVLNRKMDTHDARELIDNFLSSTLTPIQRPRILKFVSEIQVGTTGKVVSK